MYRRELLFMLFAQAPAIQELEEVQAFNAFADSYNAYVILRHEGKNDYKAQQRLRHRWDRLAKTMHWKGCE